MWAIARHLREASDCDDWVAVANGLIEPAEAGLRAAIQSDALGDSAQRGWLMLFELLQQRADKAAFDSLTIEYVLRFESSPPAWIEYKDETAALNPAGAAKPAGAPVIVLPDAVDASVVKHLEQLKQQSLVHQAITLDASNVRTVDMIGAELLLRVINAFKRASHELIVMGADQLVTPLRAAVEAGRRDPSDAVWMLLLEVFRLLNRQHDFEETGIQYCITYEVSPPSWEPPPPNLKTRAAQPQAGLLQDSHRLHHHGRSGRVVGRPGAAVPRVEVAAEDDDLVGLVGPGDLADDVEGVDVGIVERVLDVQLEPDGHFLFHGPHQAAVVLGGKRDLRDARVGAGVARDPLRGLYEDRPAFAPRAFVDDRQRPLVLEELRPLREETHGRAEAAGAARPSRAARSTGTAEEPAPRLAVGLGLELAQFLVGVPAA